MTNVTVCSGWSKGRKNGEEGSINEERLPSLALSGT